STWLRTKGSWVRILPAAPTTRSPLLERAAQALKRAGKQVEQRDARKNVIQRQSVMTGVFQMPRRVSSLAKALR
ncbi:hypothetical protein, partial [Azohydromonas lata]|uniref:hypothetical protein n=1 Tax=Azohydromonas lata TaxID=45677 RepID=UPI001C3F392B